MIFGIDKLTQDLIYYKSLFADEAGMALYCMTVAGPYYRLKRKKKEPAYAGSFKYIKLLIIE